MLYLKGVSTLRLEAERCTGCGVCTLVCPRGVLEVRERKVRVTEADACMECGACVNNCAAGALQVQRGVGCAQAVINSALGRSGEGCCYLEQPEGGEGEGSCCGPRSRCC